MRVTIISSANDDAAGERDQRRPGELAAEGRSAIMHAGEADQHRSPAPPADLLAEQQRRERRDVDRAREIERDRVGERQIDIAQKNIATSIVDKHDAQDLQAPAAARAVNAALPGAPDERRQQDAALSRCGSAATRRPNRSRPAIFRSRR